MIKNPNPQEMTNAEIEAELRSSLHLYTALWFVTLTNQSLNLTFTTTLMRLVAILRFIEELKRIAVLGR